MAELHDTTEQYLVTILELEEEGIPPLRARLVERLELAAPTVSETVARLEHEGLVEVGEDRKVALTPSGREVAVSVVRKHRLAERLLSDVIGLEWSKIHLEACRWEHVISDEVAARLVDLLGDPGACPHGNPIPGSANAPSHADAVPVGELSGGPVRVVRVSEDLETDPEALELLERVGFIPGKVGKVVASDAAGVTVAGERGEALLPPHVARLTFAVAG